MLKSILVVEDDRNDADLVLLSFAESKIANPVVLQRDGAAALEYLMSRKEEGEIPLVLLLDIKLPRVSGMEVLKELRTDRYFDSLPIVMVTSSEQDVDLKEAYHHGVNAYIVKPIEFANFSETIQQIGFFWAALNRVPDEPAGPT